MATYKNIKGEIKLAASVESIAYLELSTDGGENYSVIDSIVVPANETPDIHDFQNAPTVDVDDPLVKIKIRIVAQTTTSTTTTTTTTTSSTTTSSTTISPGNRTFVLEPDETGFLYIPDASYYSPGDTLQLRGTFKAVEIRYLNGSEENPITVTNYPDELLTIGQPDWNGGSWSTGLNFKNSHHVKVEGQYKNSFVISGSTQTARDAYFGIVINTFSDNFEVSNLTIQNGGTGIQAKTEPLADNSATWYPNTYLNNLSIHDIEVRNTQNEGMYIGHTAIYWDLTTNLSFYGTPDEFIEGHDYVQPIKWTNVKIYNNYVHQTGADGIQTAAIDGLEVYNNEVTDWALQHNYSHNGGILIGGRSTSTNVHDNYVHDGWGELFQFYASGENGVQHIVFNNLFINNQLDGISFRPTNGAIVNISNNTISGVGGVSTRFYRGRDTYNASFMNKNLLLEPMRNGGTIYPNAYIYLEPDVSAPIEGTDSNANVKLPTIADADVDVSNWYLPNPGSVAEDAGYRRPGGGLTTTTTTITSTSTTTTTTLTSSTTTTTTTLGPNSASFAKVGAWNVSAQNQYGWLYTPQGYDVSNKNVKYPFIIFLHGQGETGNGAGAVDDLVSTGLPQILNQGDRPPGILIFAPQLATSPGTWEPNWVQAAYDYMTQVHNGDPDFFYLTGLSLGGSGTAKYVANNPDKVAAYIIATGDTQWLRDGAADVINGVRICDVPGWFHGGVADQTIHVNNGVGVIDAANILNPKPIYPFLVDTYWGIGHTAGLWNNKVYNRKNRTDQTGTAVFDYIEWFKRFKRNDLAYNATSFVVIAETSNDITDYYIALRLVNKLSTGVTKTSLLNRLSVVLTTITNSNKILIIDFGSGSKGSLIPNINKLSVSAGNGAANFIDISGVQTTIGMNVINSQWNPPNVSVNLNNEYFGFASETSNDAYRVYNTAKYRLIGLNDEKTYGIRWFYGDKSYNTTTHGGANITIKGVTKTLDNQIINTTKYVDFTNITSTGGVVDIDLTSIQSDWQGDITAAIIFESVTGGTPTTTTTSTTTTSTTTFGPTTTTSSTTSTTTTTTISPTTTTTTTLSSLAAQFNFGPSVQGVTGWVDVSGQPHAAILSAMHSGTGIGVSSMSTNLWASFAGSSANNLGATVANPTFIFPSTVTQTYWYNYSYTFSSFGPNLEINGLNPSSRYKVEILGSRSDSGISQPDRLGGYYCQDSLGTYTNETFDVLNNTANVIVFNNLKPNAAGKVFLGFYALSTGNVTNGYQFSYLNGLKVSASDAVTTTTTSTTTTTTTIAPPAGEAKFNFAATNAYSEPGFVNIVGNPSLGVLSGTQNGITVSSVTSNWQSFQGVGSSDDDGMSTGSFDEFPANTVRGFWQNYSLAWTDSDSYNLEITGLNIAKTYTIKIIGSIKTSVNSNVTSTYRCVGNGDEETPEVETLDCVDNTLTYTSFTGIAPDGTGRIRLSVNLTADAGELGLINSLIVSEEITTTTSTTTTSSTTTSTSTSSTTTTSTTSLNPSAKFNFNATAQSESGWKDVSGSPGGGAVTATDDVNGTGITVASIASKWGDFGGTANNTNGGTGTNADFPANTLLSYWYNYSLVYASNGANLKISNLEVSTSYELKMIGSRSSTAGSGIPGGQNRIMEFIVSQVATTGDASEQSVLDYAARDSVTTQTFTITSNASGEIYVGVYCSRTGDETNGDQLGYLNGLIVTKV